MCAKIAESLQFCSLQFTACSYKLMVDSSSELVLCGQQLANAFQLAT